MTITQLLSRSILTTTIVISHLSLFSQTEKNSREEYFKKYADLAIKEMKRTGIPASITLAQGSLESSNGNSDLATEANNHFGIKCHKDWDGKKFFKDDDEKNECFRVYKEAYDSYIDHSEFLKTRERYAFLFQLDPTDYKSWAHGLKKAGYATNPKYPELLIKIIEDNKLFEYDKGNLSSQSTSKTEVSKKHKERKLPIFDPKELVAPPVLIDIDNDFTVESPVRSVLKNNGVSYIISKKSDTYETIAKEYDLMSWQIPLFNDMEKDSALKEKLVVYIQPKKRKAEKKYKAHVVAKGETLQSISQLYAIRLNRLAKLNGLEPNSSLETVAQLLLR